MRQMLREQTLLAMRLSGSPRAASFRRVHMRIGVARQRGDRLYTISTVNSHRWVLAGVVVTAFAWMVSLVGQKDSGPLATVLIWSLVLVCADRDVELGLDLSGVSRTRLSTWRPLQGATEASAESPLDRGCLECLRRHCSERQCATGFG